MGGPDQKEKEGEKGFVVRDKRFSAQDEPPGEAVTKEEERGTPRTEEAPREEAPLPQINFMNFLLSISTSALIQLGEIPDPVTKMSEMHLPLAKQTIDLIAMLQEKTKGNLTSEEEKLVEFILYDLRMKYVKAAG